MTWTPRQLDLHTLDNAAAYYAQEFKRSNRRHRSQEKWVNGPALVMQDFVNFTFKDEFEFILKRIRDLLDPADLRQFDSAAAQTFTPRRDDVFERLLLEHLAINPAGEHVPGHIGKVQIGSRVVGKRVKEVDKYAPRTIQDRLMFRRQGKLLERHFYTKNVYWPVYAGEPEERALDSSLVDPLPEGAHPWPPQVLYATNPRISNEAAIAACDAIVDLLDEGTTAAEIRGRSGAQPADPDSVETGTLLFTLPMSDPAFGAAADANPGGIATAAAITDDSSADATGTLGYCRCAATGTGADDHIDGEAGTSGADFNFNTVSIVSGATVSMSSFTVTVPES